MQLTTGQIREIVNTQDPEKIAVINDEDLEAFNENERQRHFLSVDGVKNLYMAICEQAVNDYKALHKITLFKLNSRSDRVKSREEKALEDFFGSNLFLSVTGLRSKEHAIQEIERTMIAERKRKLNSVMI